MNVNGLISTLEFMAEVKELRSLGLTNIEIEGYFDFAFELGKDLITSTIDWGTNDTN